MTGFTLIKNILQLFMFISLMFVFILNIDKLFKIKHPQIQNRSYPTNMSLFEDFVPKICSYVPTEQMDRECI